MVVIFLLVVVKNTAGLVISALLKEFYHVICHCYTPATVYKSLFNIAGQVEFIATAQPRMPVLVLVEGRRRRNNKSNVQQKKKKTKNTKKKKKQVPYSKGIADRTQNRIPSRW